MKSFFLVFVCMVVQVCAAQKVAITFDDLPLNGDLPPGMSRVQIARDVVALLKSRHLPAAYGFVNAKKLEGNSDAAEALKIWAADEPMGNHTYGHMNLNQNAPEAFEREIDQNEPALELLAGKDADWHWLRYPFLHEGDTIEKRRAVCLKSSYLEIEASCLDLGRALAKLVYGHEINHVLLLHLGAFSSTILPDAFDLMEKKGFTFVTLQEAESDPVYEGDPDVGSKYGGTLLELWVEAKKIKFPPVMAKPYNQLKEICQ